MFSNIGTCPYFIFMFETLVYKWPASHIVICLLHKFVIWECELDMLLDFGKCNCCPNKKTQKGGHLSITNVIHMNWWTVLWRRINQLLLQTMKYHVDSCLIYRYIFRHFLHPFNFALHFFWALFTSYNWISQFKLYIIELIVVSQKKNHSKKI